MGSARRKSGDKYSPRICKYTIEYLGHERRATCREIMDFLIIRTKQVPTTPQLANILSKSGYFNKHKPVTIRSGMERRGPALSRVAEWSVNTDRAEKRGWLTPIED